MSYPSLSILIAAAGASERLGRAKQLVQYKGNSLLQNAVKTAHSVAPREIIVVTGAHSAAVRIAVQHPSVRWVDNPHWSEGIGGSIAIGSAAINPESTGLMILLCDQWRVSAQDLDLLVKTWRCTPERIAVAEAEGHYMPPVIFPSRCFDRLRELKGDQGARKLFKMHPELITAIPMKNAAFDLDTKVQLDTMLFY